MPSWRDFFGVATSPAPVVEERNAPMNFGREDLIPLPGSNYATWTGVYLRDDQAGGVPAAGRAERLGRRPIRPGDGGAGSDQAGISRARDRGRSAGAGQAPLEGP